MAISLFMNTKLFLTHSRKKCKFVIILESITKETGSTFVSSVYCQVDRHKYILAEVLTGRLLRSKRRVRHLRNLTLYIGNNFEEGP